MPQQWPASAIAALILEGFDDYREQFRQITNGARVRFEQAQWQEIQQASAARINLYEEKVAEVTELLRQAHADEVLLDVSQWPLVKSAYIALIDLRFDDELAETWFNSIFCGLFSHDQINDGCMFIHTTRPSLRNQPSAAQTRSYRPAGELHLALQAIFDLKAVRARGGKIAEVSALAVHPQFRKTGGAILFPLMKFMYEYCREYFDTRHIVIAVNPNKIEMYESLLFFERLQARVVDNYDFANGAPAVGATLDLIEAQARAVLDDIGADAIKTGMLGSVESTSATESSSRRTRDPGG